MTTQSYDLTPVADLNSNLKTTNYYNDTSNNAAIEISPNTPNVLTGDFHF